jgi:trehalose 6-phosphate synthase/phosphatase
MLRKSLPDAAIGFFLHIPFPSYEIFRMLPWREEILKGLTGADLIGFHTYDYARHFLSSLLRIQGLEQDFGRVTVGDRAIKVDTFPLGVDINRYSTAYERPEVKHELEALRQQVGERKVILTVDRLDFSKGIIQRLKAFEKFLSRHPEWLGRVTLLSLLVPSRTRVPEYQNLKSQVDELIGRINGQLSQPGWAPITYLYRSLPFEQLIALYLLADVTLVTPLRDGMNLVAKEYLVSRPDGTGVLVLSETAGAAAELGEAIIVNPHDEEMLVDALHQALEMPIEEQEARNATMRARLRRYDTERWADDFLSQLAKVQEVRRLHLPKRLHGELKQELVQAYEDSERRLLLLDYDGTLVPFAPTPEKAKPDEELIAVLTPLARDPKNTMVIISGRDAETLDAWLSEVGMDLVAEHGLMIRHAHQKQWEQIDDDISDEWKEQLKPVFEMFVDRTPGALLEEKGAALVWHYRRADPGLGSQRAAELIDTIEGYIANTSLHILQGHKVVEVKPSTVSKGRAAHPWLSAKTPYDFILAAGDDVTDEALFEVIPESGWTVKIGVPERSKAHFFLSDPSEVRSLLKELS